MTKNTQQPRPVRPRIAVVGIAILTPLALSGALALVGLPTSPATVENCTIEGFSGGRGMTSYVETSCGRFYTTSDVDDARIGDEYELTLKHTLVETRIVGAERVR